MTPELLLGLLALGFAGFYTWAFRVLPREGWQIIATVPLTKNTAGEWQGLNLTWYGFFVASSNVFAVAVVFLLLGTLGVSAWAVFAMIAALFVLCWPLARLIARVVEKKAYTFTVGGAVFAGVLAVPWLVWLFNATLGETWLGALPPLPAIAAGAIGYAFGEGMGRLACISFGCCYGKQVAQLEPRWQRLFAPLGIVFTGSTKKVAYAGGLEGVRVVPIQALTAVSYTLIAVAGAYLFLRAQFAAALILTLVVTQVWRAWSETLRADHRGGGRMSAYQIMALALVGYTLALAWFLPSVNLPAGEVLAGVRLLWQPAVLLFLQTLWLLLFLHTGRSMVTGATVNLFVRRERI